MTERTAMTHHAFATPLTRAGLARAAGCNIETVRHYESVGLMPPPPRGANNYRLYDARHVARLRFILRARALGFDTAGVRALLGLGEGKARSCAAVKRRAEQHLADVRARIADLARIETVLAGTVARCSGNDVPDCPLIETLSGEAVPAP